MSTLQTDVHGLDRRYEPHDVQHSPVVLYHLKKRADDWQLHLADRITTFAGSMMFVWVHVAIFVFWVASGLFGADRYPFQFLTFIVSPLRVIEDICVLDQLTGGRVDYGIGRGIAPIEHFWFDGDWFNSHDRFDDALLPQFTASSGTPAQARARIEQLVADGRCDYLVLQLHTGDMTFDEAKKSLELFIGEVMPHFV